MQLVSDEIDDGDRPSSECTSLVLGTESPIDLPDRQMQSPEEREGVKNPGSEDVVTKDSDDIRHLFCFFAMAGLSQCLNQRQIGIPSFALQLSDSRT